MDVQNPVGGSGGAVTDGVTIQGAGTAGSPIAIKQVETDATLTGAGTVASPLSAVGGATTDNVTIQGAGTIASPIAIKAVQRDATLSGAGTVASPLGAVQQTPTGWPVPLFSFFEPGASGVVIGANTSLLSATFLPCAVQFSKIGIHIVVADGANNTDVGFYNAAGTLVAHVGAQHMGSTGNQGFSVVGAPITLPPGLYFFLAATVSSTFSIGVTGGSMGFNFTTSFVATSGGACPGSITPPAIALAASITAFALF